MIVERVGFVFIFLLFFSACSNLEQGGRKTSSYPGVILDEEAYFLEKSREFAEMMLEKYPPEDHVIIGWGVNTTGTMNALREMGVSDDYLWDIPITHMNKIKPDSNGLSAKEVEDILSLKRQELLKKILPPLKKIKGKKLVLHRALWAGKTFGEFVGAFVEYMKSNGYPLPLKTQVILDSKRRADHIAKISFETNNYQNDAKAIINSLVEGEDYIFSYFKDADYHQMIINEVRDFGWGVEDSTQLTSGQVALIERDERQKKGFFKKSKYQSQTAKEILADQNWSGFKLRAQADGSCHSLIKNLLK